MTKVAASFMSKSIRTVPLNATGVEAALKMDGADDLSLAVVDMFKAIPRDTDDGHVQTN